MKYRRRPLRQNEPLSIVEVVVEGGGNFYAQINDGTNPEEITDIANDPNSPKQYCKSCPEVGDCLVGYYDEDGFYYRCKVLANTAEGPWVNFIDFGNSASIDWRQAQYPSQKLLSYDAQCRMFKIYLFTYKL